jgi:hypothetical protein
MTLKKRSFILRHKRFFSIIAVGLALFFIAHQYRLSLRPPELSTEETRIGLKIVRNLLITVDRTEFGKTPRCKVLTDKLRELLDKGRIRFSINLDRECLYRQELGSEPLLYIAVSYGKYGPVWPDHDALARRIYHEALHGVIKSKKDSKEEESDAFCLAAEVLAAIEGREVAYPVMKDGKSVWEWVNESYTETPSDKNYKPLGYSFAELAEKTGISKKM